MKISLFTYIITDNCNFNCSYCYKKRKEGSLDFPLVKKSLSFFMPYFTKKYLLNFYGGEPLLCFDLIKSTVYLAKEKNREFNKQSEFSITTNGSLLTDEILGFLNKHRFNIELSFDGFAQEIQRKVGSLETIESNIKKLLKCSNITFEINSVFTPSTVDLLSESIRYIISLDVLNIRYTLSTIFPWNQKALGILKVELWKLRNYLGRQYKEHRSVPVVNFRENTKSGIFFCSAGQDRLAISSNGVIWGCHLFADYFYGKEKTQELKKYYFGTLTNFIENHRNIYPKISSNYKKLSMDSFRTSKMECFLCSNLENCTVCPINAAFSSNRLGEILNYKCEIQKLKVEQKEIFLQCITNVSEREQDFYLCLI